MSNTKILTEEDIKKVYSLNQLLEMSKTFNLNLDLKAAQALREKIKANAK